MKRLAIAAALLLVAAAVAGVARPEGARAVDAQATDTITVSGFGSVTSIPDRATLSLGVDTRGATARAALAANAKEMRAVIDAVRAAGGQDIATQSVSLTPVTNESGSVAGFAASNVVAATVAVARAGAIIDAAVAAGANQSWGPSLSSTDARALYLRALQTAVDDARQKARVLADSADRSLGKIEAIVEGGGSAPVAYAAKLAAGDESTPIVAGPQETTATVSVTFALS